MLEVIYFLFIGVCTGVLSGLFGIGGGIISVPALIFVLQHHPIFKAADTMHIAACTSLLIMVMTSAASAHAYRQRQALLWSIFWRIIPGLCIGLVSGTTLSHLFSDRLLIHLFALFLSGVGIRLLIDAQRAKPTKTTVGLHPNQHHFSVTHQWLLIGGSFVVGNVSTLFGVGGGVLLVPLFLQLGCTMQQASGTSALCGVVSALIGMLLLSRLSQPIAHLPYTFGNLYWPAAVLIGIPSVSCAPLGARLAFHLQASLLKRLFSVVLFISAWCLF